MTGGSAALDGLDCIPRLAPGCDPTTLKISPAEGFLLSRIDGQTSWRLLHEIVGLPPSEVDRCLRDWLASGLVEVDGTPPAASPPAAPDDPWEIDVEVDDSAIDPELDLDVEIQRRILVMDGTLDREDHEILGLAPDASLRQVKRCYFKLSRAFHPDRYFRRDIGAYDQRLHRIFKRILGAYEAMSNPALRSVAPREDEPVEEVTVEAMVAEVQESDVVEAEPGEASDCAEQPEGPAQPPKELTRLERLKKRMPFKLPEEMAAERRHKGAALYFEAQEAAGRGHHDEALKTMKLAVAFDPFNDDYKRLLADCQARIAKLEAEALLGSTAGPNSSEGRALLVVLLEAACKCPFDGPTSDVTARLALALANLDEAARFATRAVEAYPDEGAFRRTLGAVLAEQGEREAAVEELKLALELNSMDNDARRLLASLTKRSQRT